MSLLVPTLLGGKLRKIKEGSFGKLLMTKNTSSQIGTFYGISSYVPWPQPPNPIPDPPPTPYNIPSLDSFDYPWPPPPDPHSGQAWLKLVDATGANPLIYESDGDIFQPTGYGSFYATAANCNATYAPEPTGIGPPEACSFRLVGPWSGCVCTYNDVTFDAATDSFSLESALDYDSIQTLNLAPGQTFDGVPGTSGGNLSELIFNCVVFFLNVTTPPPMGGGDIIGSTFGI